jgi:hypothetical protein
MPNLTATSISDAWKRVACACLESRGGEVQSLTTEIPLGQGNENLEFRAEFNELLIQSNKQRVETVARTIFPRGLWNSKAPRSELYGRYEAILPKLRKCKLNSRGIYFERLIRYPVEKNSSKTVNQLEFIISTYVEAHNHRRSALQASLYNPFIDASNAPRLGFPCLQQLAFIPDADHGLTVLAFYPIHYIFERAYGNYLGLSHLAEFMAKEMNLVPRRLMCVAGVAKLEKSAKTLKPLHLSGSEGT